MKLFLKNLYQKIVFKLSAKNSSLIKFYYKKLYKPKNPSIADFLNQFSKSNNTITALQIGANDGITHDPIHKYIKRDKWKAILLEPQKDVFEKFLQPLYANDENVYCLNVALGKEDSIQIIYRIGFSKARWATGLTSFNKNVLENAFASGHVAKQAKKEGIKIPTDTAKHIISEQVKVISLATLLKTHPLKSIDVLQIDTEGYDFEIIKLFNFKSLSPKSIIYENSHLTIEDKAACQLHLSNYNYRIINFGGNTLAIHHSINKNSIY